MVKTTGKKQEYITATGLKEKRGWTGSMLKLLNNLDYKLVDNPYYKCAPPMCLYNLKDIKRIERTKKYKELREKADKRKTSAKKAVETKTQKAVSLADTFSVTVESMTLEELRANTLDAKQWWYDLHTDYLYMYEAKNAYSAPEDVVKRWMVSYIRHNLSNYDEELEALNGRIGKKKAYKYYKEKLAEEMKKGYPELKKEIDQYMLKIA